jgi:metal-responsive CopG/Arc/MetJ family transcriptional regulator
MAANPKPSPRGRPPGGDDTMQQIAIRLPKPLLAAVDAITEGRLDQPDRSAIIRELLAEAIARRMKKGRSDQG